MYQYINLPDYLNRYKIFVLKGFSHLKHDKGNTQIMLDSFEKFINKTLNDWHNHMKLQMAV